MRVVVFGGHGRTGLLILERLTQAGHEAVGTIRNSKHMADIVRLGAGTQLLDLAESSFSDIIYAVQGADAAVFAAGSAAGETSAFDRKGTLRTVRAAQRGGVQRYISISAIGASTGMSTAGMSEEMRDYYEQKRAAAKHITGSGLDWTILEPAELTDDAGTGKVAMSVEALDAQPVARADVADVVMALLKEPKSIGKALQLGGGESTIPAAIKSALG